MPGSRSRVVLALIATLALVAAACEAEDIEQPLEEDAEAPAETAEDTAAAPGLSSDEDATIVELLAGHEEFSELVSEIGAAGLEGQLSGQGPFTVFAPTDDAFDVLPEHQREQLHGDAELLEQFVLGHVAAGEHPADELDDGETVTKLDGTERPILVTDGGDILVGSAQVIEADVQAKNGLVHVIDFALPSNPAEAEEDS